MNLLIAENDFALVGVLKPRFEAEDYAVDLARIPSNQCPCCEAANITLPSSIVCTAAPFHSA